MKNTQIFLTHPWKAVCDKHSKVLILGTFPSPASREYGFYYGHSQNIFWLTLACVLELPCPQDKNSKIKFLIDNHIALWDVLRSCEIDGASDESIKNPTPNSFKPLIKNSEISAIFTTGKKATELFAKLCADEVGMEAIYLPSTSPANRASHKKANFLERWKVIKSFLDK
ncbi:MAG: DNA-deoxyinosine glycosylase [Campylobacteraceae bacterium]|nr:DNA-deoxyinosine glycosylase [Campylobacteraceae bacterium]